MPFMEDVGSLMVANNFGTVGTSIFYSTRAKIPSGAGPYVSLIETGGLIAERVHNRPDRPAYTHPGLQIIVRAMDYIVARNRAMQVRNLLASVKNEMVDGTWYIEMDVQQEPFDGGSDELGRPKVIFNVIANKRP